MNFNTIRNMMGGSRLVHTRTHAKARAHARTQSCCLNPFIPPQPPFSPLKGEIGGRATEKNVMKH